jgi:hypothetical protein
MIFEKKAAELVSEKTRKLLRSTELCWPCEPNAVTVIHKCKQIYTSVSAC